MHTDVNAILMRGQNTSTFFLINADQTHGPLSGKNISFYVSDSGISLWNATNQKEIWQATKVDNVTVSTNSEYVSDGHITLWERFGMCFIQFNGIALKAYTGRQTIATISSTRLRPPIQSYGYFNQSANLKYFIVNPNGTIQVDDTGSAIALWGCGTFPLV